MGVHTNPSSEAQTPAGPEAREAGRVPAQARDTFGRFLPTHGAYRLERAWQRGKVPRVARRLVNRLRFEYALALGFASWASTSAPVRAAVDNAIRQQLLAERLFSGFWSGEEVSRHFYTASENLRRQLSDLGLEPRMPSKTLQDYLAQRYGGRDGGA